MTRIVVGDRIAQDATLALVCSAVLFDSRQRVLLTRRTDNGKWCLPGGHLEAGETVTEGIVREVKEETGLEIEVVRLLGVYSNPHRVLEYPDGHKFHIVALNFEARVVGGSLTVSDETSEFRWCVGTDVRALDVVESHVERIADALAGVHVVHVR